MLSTGLCGCLDKLCTNMYAAISVLEGHGLVHVPGPKCVRRAEEQYTRARGRWRDAVQLKAHGHAAVWGCIIAVGFVLFVDGAHVVVCGGDGVCGLWHVHHRGRDCRCAFVRGNQKRCRARC